MVGVEEVESPACPLGGGRSIQLSYTPTRPCIYLRCPALPRSVVHLRDSIPIAQKAMIIALAALALIAAGPAPAGEDAAHRADRLETEALNRSAANIVARRQQNDDRQQRAYRANMADYTRKMAEWRKREAARLRYNAAQR